MSKPFIHSLGLWTESLEVKSPPASHSLPAPSWAAAHPATTIVCNSPRDGAGRAGGGWLVRPPKPMGAIPRPTPHLSGLLERAMPLWLGWRPAGKLYPCPRGSHGSTIVGINQQPHSSDCTSAVVCRGCLSALCYCLCSSSGLTSHCPPESLLRASCLLPRQSGPQDATSHLPGRLGQIATPLQ